MNTKDPQGRAAARMMVIAPLLDESLDQRSIIELRKKLSEQGGFTKGCLISWESNQSFIVATPSASCISNLRSSVVFKAKLSSPSLTRRISWTRKPWKRSVFS